MASDLKLANRLWQAAQVQAKEEDYAIDYPSLLFAAMALLSDRQLAEEFIKETWDDEQPN